MRVAKLGNGQLVAVLSDVQVRKIGQVCVWHNPRQGKTDFRITDMKQSETLRWVPDTLVLWMIDFDEGEEGA